MAAKSFRELYDEQMGKLLSPEKFNRDLFIGEMAFKAPRRKPLHVKVPAHQRGTLFAIRNKLIAIREATNRNVQIVMKYKKTTTGETKEYIVAPYSWRYRRLRIGRRKMLYAYDMKEKHIKSFAIQNVKNVFISDREFVPKWKVEIFTFVFLPTMALFLS